MKHLIALSLKYIRRQKLRSLLTFCCILLAAFLFTSLGAYTGSIRRTVINQIEMREGAWEADLGEAIAKSPDPDALRIIRDHTVTQALSVSSLSGTGTSMERNAQGTLSYFDISLDGGKPWRALWLTERCYAGKADLLPAGDGSYGQEELPDNGMIVPRWIRDEAGYAEGDLITITVTPMRGTLTEEQAQVQRTRAFLEERSRQDNTDYLIEDDPEPRPAERNCMYSDMLLSYMLHLYSLEEIDFADVQAGAPYTFTGRIVGFAEHDFSYRASFGEEYAVHDLEVLTSANSCIGLAHAAGGLTEQDGIFSYASPHAYVRLDRRISPEDAVRQLLEAIGLPGEENYYDVTSHGIFNTSLLAAELRGEKAFETLFPFILGGMLLAIVLWFTVRFIIDSAFEMSVQERSRQFAALRVMGASKGQLLALVVTEAVCCCLTAVPLGAGLALLLCRTVMEGFRKAGMSFFAFSVDWPVVLLAVALCIIAVFISAYTSAMWAARKLSPLEALHYGKPASRRKARPAAAFRDARHFMLHYTLRNIGRTWKRFVASGIAMALGVMLFTLSVMACFVALSGDYAAALKRPRTDFYIYVDHADAGTVSLAEATLEKSGIFGGVSQICHYTAQAEGLAEKNGEVTVSCISRSVYEELLEPLLGKDYDAFTRERRPCLVRRYVQTDSFVPLETAFTLNGEQMVLEGIVGLPLTEASGWLQAALEDGCLVLPMTPPEAPVTDRILLTVGSGHEYEEALAQVQTFLADCGDAEFADLYLSGTGLARFLRALLLVLGSFLLSIWLVGVLTMVNTVNASVLNRREELRMMKALGMTMKQLMDTVYLESSLFSMVSTFVGIAGGMAGYGVILGFMRTFGVQGETPVEPLPWSGAVLAALLVLVLNLAISYLAAVPAVRTFRHENQ